MAHQHRTHTQYYRLHESSTELAKISKLFIAVDSCDAQTWSGKSLDTIDLTPDVVLDNNLDHDDDRESNDNVDYTEENEAPMSSESKPYGQQ